MQVVQGRSEVGRIHSTMNDSDSDPNALYVLSLACLHGDGVPQDGAEAARWLAQGHAGAQYGSLCPHQFQSILTEGEQSCQNGRPDSNGI